MSDAAVALHELVKPRSLLQLSAEPHKLAAVALSTKKADPQFVVDAGSAPPPPPPTWDAGASYGGASGEQQGIVGILEMVKEDIKKDISAAEDEEAQSVKDFNKEIDDLKSEIKATDSLISDYQKDKAAQE